jgi:hypothetical protein
MSSFKVATTTGPDVGCVWDIDEAGARFAAPGDCAAPGATGGWPLAALSVPMSAKEGSNHSTFTGTVRTVSRITM